MIRFDELTVLDVVGTDAAQIVNNLCTGPVATLAPGNGCEAFVTEARGRTLGHGCIYRLPDRLRLVGAPGQADALASHFDRYTIREDAVPHDVSTGVRGLLLSAQELRLLSPAADFAPPTSPTDLRWWELDLAEEAGTAVPRPAEETPSPFACLVPWTAPANILILAVPEMIGALHSHLGDRGAVQEDEAEFHRRRVAHRFPWFGIDMDDRNLPQEADRDAQAVSFTKGCYLGQETVARLDALGQVQKKLVLWRLDADRVPAAGTELVADDRTVGRLTSVVRGEDEGTLLALGFARRSHFDPGAKAVWTDDEGNRHQAIVL